MSVVRGPIVIAGGGTAGHVLPGLAVAAELTSRGLALGELLWIGSSRGQEAALVRDAGIELVALPGRGIQRRLTLENLSAAWGLIVAFAATFRRFRRSRPSVVLTLGGYASLAAAASAVLLRVPIVVAEQNARAGAANRLVARFARHCAVPFADTDLPHAVVCGNPVRAEILAAATDRDVDAARAALEIAPGRTAVVVFAGSLGSRRINEAVLDLVERWNDREDLHVHHVLGRRDFAELADRFAALTFSGHSAGRISYRAVEYENRMDLALVAADLAICRSGGTTVAELAILAVPSILVPLPIATRDHQSANAAELVAAGAAVLIADAACTVDRLERELAPIVDDPQRRTAMAQAAASTGHPDAAARVADLVLGAQR